MTLERRIEVLTVQLQTQRDMLEKDKNSEKLIHSIEYDQEILDYLLELAHRREAHAI